MAAVVGASLFGLAAKMNTATAPTTHAGVEYVRSLAFGGVVVSIEFRQSAPPVCPGQPNWECQRYHNSWWPNATVAGAVVFPYAECGDYQTAARLNHTADVVPYLPNVIAGFDPRPWEEASPSFAMPSQAEWELVLRQVFVFVVSAVRHPRAFTRGRACLRSSVRVRVCRHEDGETETSAGRTCKSALPDDQQAHRPILSHGETTTVCSCAAAIDYFLKRKIQVKAQVENPANRFGFPDASAPNGVQPVSYDDLIDIMIIIS